MLARRDAAIEAAVEELPWMIRSIGASMLESSARYCPAYELVVTAEDLYVLCEGRQPVARPIDGAAVPWTRESDGKTFETRVAWEGDALVLRFAGEHGGRSTTYRVVDGQLEVGVAVRSERLSQPVAYSVRYDRVAPGP